MRQPVKPGVAGPGASDPSLAARPEFGVYVHYPLCNNRCGYCEFATVAHPAFPHAEYASAVLREAQWRAPDYSGWALRCIYFGGGTPSLWPPQQVARVIAGLAARFRIAEGLEVTLEANPDTLDDERLGALRRAGVDRISLGLQSLDDQTLRALTREHSAQTSRVAFARCRAAGFDNISCDVIFGHQGQTVTHHLEQLDAVVALGPEHISTYALSLSRGSRLYRDGHRPVDEDRSAEMMEQGRARLEAAGYLHYEVSNFARPGRRSQHNALVWAGRPYLGLGASAHSMLPAGMEAWRVANPPFSVYIDAPLDGGPPPAPRGAKIERIDAITARYEVMLLGVRTAIGVDRRAYAERFGEDPLASYGEVLARLEAQGLLVCGPAFIAPTRRGMWFADEIAVCMAA